jgi:hypothetical protein
MGMANKRTIGAVQLSYVALTRCCNDDPSTRAALNEWILIHDEAGWKS